MSALLLIGVYLVYRIRRRRKLREWKEEERTFYGDVDEDEGRAEEDEDEDDEMRWKEEDER